MPVRSASNPKGKKRRKVTGTKKVKTVKAEKISVPSKSTEDKWFQFLFETYQKQIIREEIVHPIRNLLNPIFEKFGGYGPKPQVIARAWLRWRQRTRSKKTAIKDIRIFEPGKMYLEFDPFFSPKQIGDELTFHMKARKNLEEWWESKMEKSPHVGRSQRTHPINQRDFILDALIVIGRNAGHSYPQISTGISSIKILDWPFDKKSAVNRLKKRVEILRKGLGPRILPKVPPAMKSG